MQIEIAILCTVIGLILSLATFYLTRRKEIKNQTEIDVERMVRMDEKLDGIKQMIEEFRLDSKELSKNLQQLNDRVTIVEESTKSIHQRVESLEEWYKK